MKLSCLPVSYYPDIINGRMTIQDWAREASELGLDAIDISVLFLKNQNESSLKSMRENIEKNNIFVNMVAAYPDFTHPDKEERKNQKEIFKEHIKFSSFVGAKMVRVTAGQAHPETGRKAGIQWAIEGIKDSVDFAEKHGIKLLFENHSKPGIWDFTDFSTPTDIFLEMADAIIDTSIGILFDTANPIAYGDDPVKLLEKVIDRVECLHIADTETSGCLQPVLIGTGLVPFNDIFAVLKSNGYKGWLSIEEASFTGKDGSGKAVAFTREMMKNL